MINDYLLRLYMTVPTTQALGPGKRYALWVQGCNKRCKGCISPDSRSMEGGYVRTVAELAQEICTTPEIEGITISGGEPFLQAQALTKLIQTIRQKRDLGVIVYTGMRYEEIAQNPLCTVCDLLIDGEYIEELNDGRSLRGSSNQRVISLTERYKDSLEECYGRQGRKIELLPQNGKIVMVGIPSKSTANMIGVE